MVLCDDREISYVILCNGRDIKLCDTVQYDREIQVCDTVR